MRQKHPHLFHGAVKEENSCKPSAHKTPAVAGLILATCCLSLFMIFMDVTVVNVALPAIRHEFQASTSTLQWTVDGYTVVVASFLLLAGSMADRFGRRRVFQCGMAVFSVGSALCGLAPSAAWLVAFRAMQALGGSMLNPVAMAIITNTFLAPRERARAIGVWGSVAGIAMAAGPLVGGILTQFVGWRANFWVNLPIGAIAIVSAQVFIPESRAAKPRPVDVLGQILVIVFLCSLMASIIQGPSLGWRSPIELSICLISATALALLSFVELRTAAPLIDFQLFRVFPFTSASCTAICAFAGFGALLFSASLILHGTYKLSAAQSGLCILPMAMGAAVFSPISARMIARGGATPSFISSGLLIALSAVMLLVLGNRSSLFLFVLSGAVFGMGFGMVNAPITYTAVSGLPRDRAGVAAAFASSSRQIGVALGVALAGVVGGSDAFGRHESGEFQNHMDPLWWLIFLSGLLIAGLGYIAASSWSVETARHAEHLFANESKD